MKSLLPLSLPTGVLLGISIGAACSSPMPSHCANLEGDKTCAERGGGAFCDQCRVDGEECVAEQPSEDCYHPGPADDGSTSGGSESTSGETPLEPTTETTETTTEPMSCRDDADCTSAAAPFCEPSSGQCVACDATSDPDDACEGLDPATPLCVGGQCTECTPENPVVCDEQLLVCDGTSNTCVACDEHEQCVESGACELAVGRCFPPDVVVHVDGDGGQDFTSIGAAVGAIDDGGVGVIVVHERNGNASYTHVLVDAGKTIALLAAPGERPIIQALVHNPGIRVEGEDTALYVDRLEVRGNPMSMVGRGMEVDGALARLDRSRIVQNAGGGILAENGAELTLTSSFVAANGFGAVGSRGLEVTDAVVHVLYTTIARNDALSADSIHCMDGLVDVRNSIVVGDDASSIDCPAIVITNSALDESVAGNDNVAPFNPAWFASVASHDYHLSGLGFMTFAGIARWQAGDPRTDFDGDLRPTDDGASDHAGADRPAP